MIIRLSPDILPVLIEVEIIDISLIKIAIVKFDEVTAGRTIAPYIKKCIAVFAQVGVHDPDDLLTHGRILGCMGGMKVTGRSLPVCHVLRMRLQDGLVHLRWKTVCFLPVVGSCQVSPSTSFV